MLVTQTLQCLSRVDMEGAGWHSGSKKGSKSTSGRCFLAQMFHSHLGQGEIKWNGNSHSQWWMDLRAKSCGTNKEKRKILRSQVLMSINGYDLSVKENPNAVKAFSWLHRIENNWNMELNGSWFKSKSCAGSNWRVVSQDYGVFVFVYSYGQNVCVCVCVCVSVCVCVLPAARGNI